MTDAMYEMPGSSERPTELRITLSYAREKFDRSRMSQLKVAWRALCVGSQGDDQGSRGMGHQECCYG
jgi:hypothetical protein